MKIICRDRIQKSGPASTQARGLNAVSADVDGLFGSKSYEELEKIEDQIKAKLGSNEPIDIDYWEHLMRQLIVWKAKAKLRRVSQSIVESRMKIFRKQQQNEAQLVCSKLHVALTDSVADTSMPSKASSGQNGSQSEYDVIEDTSLPLLKVRPGDKGLEIVDEGALLARIVSSAIAVSH
jgi:hypothetical protein